MSQAAHEPAKRDISHLYARGFEPILGRDWALLALATLDVLLLLGRDVYGSFIPPLFDRVIVGIDVVVVVIFLIDFLVEGAKASSKIRYAKNHWYDIVGFAPVAHWGFRIFRLVRGLRMYVVAHFPQEAYEERSWHTALVRGAIGHYRDVILEEITDPIVLASINAIEGPLVRARFAGTIGDRLEQRREHLHKLVDDNVAATRGVGPLLSTRVGQRLVNEVTDEVLDQVILTLRSDELNEVLSESIEDVLQELRVRVREKEYRVAGGSRLRPVTGGRGGEDPGAV